MADITLLPSAKVPLIYDGELTMTTEWYRFFWNIYGFTGSGVVPVNRGGTGLNTIGDHQLIIGNANNVFEPASLSSASIAITYPAGFINLELGTSGVTPGTYGSASQVGVFTVNQYGVLTAASNTSISINASQITSGTLLATRGGTGQSTYAVGDILYATSTTALSKLAIGASTYFLTSSGTAPQWTIPSSVTVGTATNLAGGLANQIPYQTGAGATTFMVAPTIAGTYLNWSGSAFQWSSNPLGDVVGPASATDNAIARFDSTTGKLIQNSVVTIGDTGATTGITTLSASTSVTTPIVQASNSAGLALKNASGTTQISMGAGGGDNLTIAVATNINGANAQIDISPTGTGHVHIKPTGTGAVEIAPTNAGTMNNMVIGGITPLAGSFTDLSVTGTTSFDGSQGTAGQVLTSAGTGATPTWTTPTTGTVTSVTGTAPVVSSGGNTPAISMAAATGSVNGYLTSTDWTTFNGKAPAVTYTTNYIPYGQGTTTPNQSAGLQFDGTNFTTTGYATATSFRPSSSTVPTNGMYLPAANAVGIATNSTERMRVFSSGGVSIGNTTDAGAGSLLVNKVVSVGGATPTTSGAGITFPATQSASTDVNTLDDYEEGTWTPTYAMSGVGFTSISMTVNFATYTKVGRQVTISAYIQTSAINTTGATGVLLITGLPFAVASSQNYGFHVGLSQDFSTNYPSSGFLVSSQMNIYYLTAAGGTMANCTAASMATGASKNTLMFTATYFV